MNDTPSYQETVCKNIEFIKEQLKGYISVDPKYFECVPVGTRVRYITDKGKFRFGGKLIKNGSPKFFVLKNAYKNVTWSVNLEKNYIYIFNEKESIDEKIEKDNLYKLYKAGYVKILEEPELEQEDKTE